MTDITDRSDMRCKANGYENARAVSCDITNAVKWRRTI